MFIRHLGTVFITSAIVSYQQGRSWVRVRSAYPLDYFVNKKSKGQGHFFSRPAMYVYVHMMIRDCSSTLEQQTTRNLKEKEGRHAGDYMRATSPKQSK